MIKNLKYMFAAAAFMVAVASCQEDAEDAFSKVHTAPVLAENNAILLTENTMTESITWAWTSARFTKGDVTYQLYASYEDQEVAVGEPTTALTSVMSKTDFKKLIDTVGAPENSSFTIKMFVRATDAEGSFDSDAISVTVYSYGNAVAAVVSAAQEEIVLNMETPEEEVALLTWDAARLGYNEDILYSVYCSYNGGTEVELATKLSDCSYTTTVDALNEAVVAAGAPEEAAADVDFVVYAQSATVEAIPSEKATISVTTYKATYPEKLYLAGDFESWTPANGPTIPQSTLTKGLFEAFVDLSNGTNEETQFKFCIKNDWGGDFGSDDFTVTVGGQNNTTIVKGTTVGSGNITVPAGFYRVSCDMKHKTLEMEKVVSVGLIGSAVSTGWSSEIKMEYDSLSHSYSVKTTLSEGEYKFRINDDWDYSIGDNGAFSGGANYAFAKEAGEYNVILNVGSHPYSVKVLSTNFPVKLYMPGDYCGWTFGDDCNTLEGNGEGIYEGGVQLGSEGSVLFKFSPTNAWSGDFGCDNLTLGEDGNYTGTYGSSDNLSVPAGYYYITVDMTTTNVTLVPITSLGVIGGFEGNSWGSDVTKLTYDATNKVWTGSYQFTAGVEWKIRANDAWTWNRGGSLTVGTPSTVVNNGSNCSVTADGTYTIKLDLAHNPNTLTVSK